MQPWQAPAPAAACGGPAGDHMAHHMQVMGLTGVANALAGPLVRYMGWMHFIYVGGRGLWGAGGAGDDQGF